MLDDSLDNYEISLYEEAENTWKLGEKFSLYVKNDEDIVESLARNTKTSMEEPLKNNAKNKQ